MVPPRQAVLLSLGAYPLELFSPGTFFLAPSRLERTKSERLINGASTSYERLGKSTSSGYAAIDVYCYVYHVGGIVSGTTKTGQCMLEGNFWCCHENSQCFIYI